MIASVFCVVVTQLSLRRSICKGIVGHSRHELATNSLIKSKRGFANAKRVVSKQKSERSIGPLLREGLGSFSA